MLKENRNMCKEGGTEEHTLSSQVPSHPIQSKNKIYIYTLLIKYFNTYTDTNPLMYSKTNAVKKKQIIEK